MKKAKNMGKFNYKVIAKELTHVDANGNYICQPQICDTTQYEMLQFLKNNRNVAPSHVSKMGRSVTSLKSIMRDIVVVCIKGGYFIVDGQHLFSYLKSVNLPIRFKLVHAKDEKEAMQIVTYLNSSSRNWGIQQFIDSWCDINKEYNILKTFQKMYALTATTIAALLTNNTIANAKKQIISGDFKVTDKADAVRRLQAIELFYNVTGMDRSQYATTGIINYMGLIGIEKYIKEEKQFLNCIRLGVKRRELQGKTLGRKDDYIAFFNECRNR